MLWAGGGDNPADAPSVASATTGPLSIFDGKAMPGLVDGYARSGRWAIALRVSDAERPKPDPADERRAGKDARPEGARVQPAALGRHHADCEDPRQG